MSETLTLRQATRRIAELETEVAELRRRPHSVSYETRYDDSKFDSRSFFAPSRDQRFKVVIEFEDKTMTFTGTSISQEEYDR